MFCTKCGKEISNDAVFCPECGNRVGNNATSTQQTQNTYNPNPTYHQQTPPSSAKTSSYSNNNSSAYDDYVSESEKNGLAVKILIFGILSLAISFIPGWIFGSIAKNKAEEFTYLYGGLYGAAKVGKILGTIGLILSIISTIGFALYFAIICCSYGSMFLMYM